LNKLGRKRARRNCPESLVTYIENGKVWTDSKKLAEEFSEKTDSDKRHADVMRKIRNMLKDTSPEFAQKSFALVENIEKNAIGGDVDLGRILDVDDLLTNDWEVAV
jgi:hypothetical protein